MNHVSYCYYSCPFLLVDSWLFSSGQQKEAGDHLEELQLCWGSWSTSTTVCKIVNPRGLCTKYLIRTATYSGGHTLFQSTVTSSGSVQTLWACTPGPLIYSNDGGDTWVVLEESVQSFQGIRLICTSSDRDIWVATPCDISRGVMIR